MMKTSCVGLGNGSGRRSTPLTTLKIAVFAPMPSASVNTATSGESRRADAGRESRSGRLASTGEISSPLHMSLVTSRTVVALPKSRRALRAASLGRFAAGDAIGDRPCRDARASPARALRRVRAGSSTRRSWFLHGRWAEQLADGFGELLPARALVGEPRAAGARESIDAHALALLGRFPRRLTSFCRSSRWSAG